MGADDQGTTAIEFAFVGPIFFVLVFAILQYSYIFVAETMIDDAVFVSVRDLRTGAIQTAPPQDHDDILKRRICRRLDVIILNCADQPSFVIEVNTFPNFRSIDLSGATPQEAREGGGGPGDIVVVTANYDLPLFGLNHIGFDNVATITLRSFAIFRNEPFTLAAQGSR